MWHLSNEGLLGLNELRAHRQKVVSPKGDWFSLTVYDL